METKRQIEIFSAGCALCRETVEMVRQISCDDFQVTIRDMTDPETVARAKELGVKSVPAVAIDGNLAGCCAGSGPDEAGLRAEGIE